MFASGRSCGNSGDIECCGYVAVMKVNVMNGVRNHEDYYCNRDSMIGDMNDYSYG